MKVTASPFYPKSIKQLSDGSPENKDADPMQADPYSSIAALLHSRPIGAVDQIQVIKLILAQLSQHQLDEITNVLASEVAINRDQEKFAKEIEAKIQKYKQDMERIREECVNLSHKHKEKAIYADHL